MTLIKKHKHLVNGEKYEDFEFFLNDKTIAYATMQDDWNYFSIDICAEKDGEITEGAIICPCSELLDNIFKAFPEWEKMYNEHFEDVDKVLS